MRERRRVRPASLGYRTFGFIGAILGGLTFFFSAILELWWFLYISPVSLFYASGDGALSIIFLVGASYGGVSGFLVRSLTLHRS